MTIDDLKTQIATLRRQRFERECSNDRAWTDGTIARFDRQIEALERQLAEIEPRKATVTPAVFAPFWMAVKDDLERAAYARKMMASSKPGDPHQEARREVGRKAYAALVKTWAERAAKYPDFDPVTGDRLRVTA